MYKATYKKVEGTYAYYGIEYKIVKTITLYGETLDEVLHKVYLKTRYPENLEIERVEKEG